MKAAGTRGQALSSAGAGRAPEHIKQARRPVASGSWDKLVKIVASKCSLAQQVKTEKRETDLD